MLLLRIVRVFCCFLINSSSRLYSLFNKIYVQLDFYSVVFTPLLLAIYISSSQGFVIVKDLFTVEELQPVIDGVNELVNNLANRLFAAGKIKGL